MATLVLSVKMSPERRRATARDDRLEQKSSILTLGRPSRCIAEQHSVGGWSPRTEDKNTARQNLLLTFSGTLVASSVMQGTPLDET